MLLDGYAEGLIGLYPQAFTFFRCCTALCDGRSFQPVYVFYPHTRKRAAIQCAVSDIDGIHIAIPEKIRYNNNKFLHLEVRSWIPPA